MTTTGSRELSTTPVLAGQLRAGLRVILKGHPCKLTQFSISKTGKHGHAKCKGMAEDIFTKVSYPFLAMSHDKVQQPEVREDKYQLLAVDSEGYLSLLNDGGEIKRDLKCAEGDDELSAQIIATFDRVECGEENDDAVVEIRVLCALDMEKVVGVKETTIKI
eukprot:gene19285-14768_t